MILAFSLAAFLALLISPVVIWWYRKNHWVENPRSTHHVKTTHQFPVPRGGGLVIFLSVFGAGLFFFHFDQHLLGIFLGAVLLTLIGFLDDLFDLHPLLRLFIGALAALCVVGSGIGIPYVTNPFGSGVIHLDQPQVVFSFFGTQHHIWILADILAFFFILWNMNIVNWSKGLDGQMPGFVAIAAIFIGVLSLRFMNDPQQLNTTLLAFLVAGAFIGFLFWNFYPQKIMPGYGAGSLAGYFLAVLSILSGAKIATTIMVLAIPTADAAFTITRRLIAGKSPFWGDRGHLHHKLMDVLGWGRRRVAIFYWATTFIMGVFSLYFNTISKVATVVFVWIFVFGFLVWAKLQSKRQIRAS